MSVVKQFQANPDVSCADEGEEGALLYNPDKDDSIILNRTGRDLWAFLAAPHCLEEVVQHLTGAFPGLTSEQAQQDATKFVESLTPDFIVLRGDEAGGCQP